MRHLLGRIVAIVFLSLAGSTALAADDKDVFFNGKNLDGWEGLQFWSVKDGAIVGDTSPDGAKHNTFLCSNKKYKDFELKFQVRLKGGTGNSGVQIRSEILDKGKLTVKGPQADIALGYWGSLYGENFGGMMKEADKDAVAKVLKKDDFNDYYIKCVDKHVTIKLNGTTTVDDDFDKMPDEGIIAWQIHQGGAMEVTFKNIEFKDLGDSAATKLLADAIAARATWKDFPGFVADVEITGQGQGHLARGKVQVNEKGKVDIQLDDTSAAPELADSAKPLLASLVGHRLPSSSDQKTPCKFGDENLLHPQGRLVVPMEDEPGSSYRIQDRQILVVNRKMKETTFTITVLENRLNEEKLYLPASYVVNFWDAKTDALTRSQSFHHTWVRVGKFDLPETIDRVTASTGKQESLRVKLSNHKLAR